MNKGPEITIHEVTNWAEFDRYPPATLVVAIKKVADLWNTKAPESTVRVGYFLQKLISTPVEMRENYERVFVITGTCALSDNAHIEREFFATPKLRGSQLEGDMRMVRRYIGEDDQLGFFLGITTHVGGGSWSSSQLHNFELAQIMSPLVEPFPEFKEYFAFFTHPSGMWGLQVHGQNKPGEVAVVKDGDIIDVPIGPHAVVAGPGTRLGYIWIYTGAWSKEL